MAYADVEHVAIYNQQRTYSASSKPSVSQVKVICAWVASVIDAALANIGYVVPVTAPISLSILQDLNAMGAAASAEMAAFMGANPNESQHASMLHKRFEQRLADIVSGKLKLPDAPQDFSGTSPMTGFAHCTSEGKKPVFSYEALRDFTDLHKVLSYTEFKDWLVQNPQYYGAMYFFEGIRT